MPDSLIGTDHGHLEYTLDEPDNPPRFQAVVAHPHPEHGGSMHNKVVYHTAKALAALGGITLRFNFRGVGQSTGEFDDGVGERADFMTAVQWLKDNTGNVPFVIGGFSFGSMVALSLLGELEDVDGALGIGLPLKLYDFDDLKDVDVPTLVVQGERDEFGPYALLERRLGHSNERLTLKRIDDADHFLTDRYTRLKTTIKNCFSTGGGQSVIEGESTDHGRGIP